MFTLSVITAVITVIAIIVPFFIGKGGALQVSASINSIELLEASKEAILQRFLQDEKAFENKTISKLAWEQRRTYLVNRYIDAARRLDFLNAINKQNNHG